MKQLHYKKGKSFFLPENWNELTSYQLCWLAPLLYSKIDSDKAYMRALFILSGLSVFRFMLLPPQAVLSAMEHIDWVFETNSLTRQLLPSYRHFFQERLYGPASDFDNLTMKEFHLTELYYRQVADSDTDGSDDNALNMLIAVLYRAGKKDYDFVRNPDGDARQPMNHNLIPYRAKKVSRWPLWMKQAIFTWYDGNRQALIDANERIFKEPEKNGYESEFDTGLYGMIRSLAGDRLGTIEKVEQMNVHTALLELNLVKEEERIMEEQLKANS